MTTIQLLDKNLRPCLPKSAEFQSLKSREGERLETYTSELAASGEAWAESQAPDPMGLPNGKGRRQVAGIDLEWDDNRWTHKAATFEIVIEPTCNVGDVEKLAAEIKKLQPILVRGIVRRELIVFHLGAIPEMPCVAFSKGNRLGFPLCETGRGLLAPSICAANPDKIDLGDIVLHELGHVLKKYFAQEMEDLARTLRGSFALLGEETNRISPQYLGVQHQRMVRDLAVREACALLENTEETLKEYNNAARKIERETFAEMVRFYYLEPCLTKKPRKAPQTPCHTYNAVAKTMIEEAAINLSFRLGSPSFPKSGEIAEI